MKQPHTIDEWQTAVDAALDALALHAAQAYGLVSGGPVVNVERCRQVLKEGEALACRPMKMFTPADLQEILGIGESKELELRQSGQISHFAHGKTIRYTAAAVLEFILANTVRARRAPGAQLDPLQFTLDWARIQRLIEVAGGKEAGVSA
jgi:hypothetical protein